MSSTVSLDSGNQVFLLQVPGFTKLRFAPRAELNGREVKSFNWKLGGARPGEQQYRGQNRWGKWKLRVRGTSSLEILLEAQLLEKPDMACLYALSFSEFSASHVLTHGRKMGGCESIVLAGRKQHAADSHFLVLVTRNRHTMQFSHPLEQRDISRFAVTTAGKKVQTLSASTQFDRCRGKLLRASPVTISASLQGHDLMVNWAKDQAGPQEMRPVPQESGWNSWDYYRWTITEDEVYKNADLIASDPVLSRHVKRIIVDDGWQYCYGEWEPNGFFPSGMKKIARNLGRMGFSPGLWFAPTIVEPHSRLAQLHPDTLAKGASGFPCLAFSCMERKGFILDPTHPQVRRYWEELFRRYAEYGFKYFKLDFLASTVGARTFWDRATKPGELMQRIISPIRSAVGPSCRILGCNYDFEKADGLVDDVRISADIHSRWSSVKENVSSMAARFWAHRRLWINDPDFTLCRGEETANDPNLHQLKPILPFVRPEDTNPSGFDYLDSLVDLSVSEAEVLVSLVILSGGAMNLSDNLPRLNETGLEILRKAVSAEKGNAAMPIDLFQSSFPEFWVQKLDSGLHRLLMVNWGQRHKKLEIDLGRLNVPHRAARDFWTDRPVRIQGGRLAAVLPAHSCLLVESKN